MSTLLMRMSEHICHAINSYKWIFVGVFTDDQNRNHYGDSIESVNEVAINPSVESCIIPSESINK